MMSPADLLSGTLALRERVREVYWKRRDPIIKDRMLWRAQTFRHVMHVLPGQSISKSAVAARHLPDSWQK